MTTKTIPQYPTTLTLKDVRQRLRAARGPLTPQPLYELVESIDATLADVELKVREFVRLAGLFQEATNGR